MTYEEKVKRYYLKAIDFGEFGKKLGCFLEGKGYPFDKTLLASCFCSDDINAMQMPESITAYHGPFHMGGLAGFPFAGQTGMAAYSSHKLKDGTLLVLFAPHIGISETGPLGTVGKVKRLGQSRLTDDCGAVRAALTKVLESPVRPDPTGEIDHQQDEIVRILWEDKQRILCSTRDQMIEATQIIYERSSARLQELVWNKTVCETVILVGGIFINVDYGKKAFFSFKNCYTFEAIDVVAKQTTSFASEFANLLKNGCDLGED